MKKLIFTIIIALGISTFFAGTCMAGDMNADESRVYSAAGGTFTYNNESYRSTPEYMAKLSAYLCRDDIDLSSAQADASIRTMNRSTNIKKAISSGYLVAVSAPTPSTENGNQNGGTSTETSTEKTNTNTNTNTNSSTNTNTNTNTNSTEKTKPGTNTSTEKGSESKSNTGKGSDSDKSNSSDVNNQGTSSNDGAGTSAAVGDDSNNNQASVDKTSTFDSNASAEEASFTNKKNQQQREEILETRPQKTEAPAGVVTYDEVNNEIVFSGSHDQTIVIPSSFQKIKGTHTRNLFAFAEGLLLVITISCGIAFFVFRCYSFQKKSNKNHYGNHKTRRKLRSILGNVVVVVMAVNIFVVLMGAGIQIGMFQNARVTDTLSSSGYYHESYQDLLKEVHAKMLVADCPQNACDDVITYDNYLFATRNHVQMALKGQKSTAEYSDISTDVASALEGVTYLTDDSRKQIGQDVLALYQQYVGNIIGESMHGMKQIFDNIFGINMILAILDIIVSVLILLFMDHYKHRGMKKIAAAIGIASFVVLAASIVIIIFKPYSKLYIEPDYLYLFVAAYIRFVTKVFICLAAGGAVLAALVQFAGAGMKKRLQES